MNVAVAPQPPRSRVLAGVDAAARRLGLDWFELATLIALAGLSLIPLAALLSKGRPLSGADGLLATDQMQYLAWIREASNHVLIGNVWDLAPGDRAFLHPGFLLSGVLHRVLGVSIPLAYLLWKPVAIGVTFGGCLAYCRRLLPAGGQRRSGLVLALFAVMPAVAIVAFTGIGGKPTQYTFDFISGEMWSSQYLWGYLLTSVAVFTVPFVLLGVERWRARPGARLLVLCGLGALMVTWLQPWQGAELGLIVFAAEGLRWWRGGTRPAVPALLAVGAGVALPSAYYFVLSHADPAWELAGQANQPGAQALWSWPWWAMALTLAPLAIPAAFAYRRPAPAWQDVAVRIWPFAVLAVYLLPLGTFPYHSFQGLALPLSILAVQGVASTGIRLRPAVVVAILAVMTLPGIAHKLDVARSSVQAGGDPFYVFPGEVAALKALERDPRPGGVLAPTYASFMTPYRTGREVYVGPFSWTPNWRRRQQQANDLFEGRLTGAKARAFVRSTNARWLFADCRPLTDLTDTLRPLLAGPPRRYGCATVYELKYRPAMGRAAGSPDA